MNSRPSMDEWKRLYDLALRFKEMRAWEWMDGDDMFGVREPETGEIGYCCVMGMLGEVYGLVVYTGQRGLESYLTITTMQNPEDPDNVFIQEGVAVSFEDRGYLKKVDL